MNKLAISAIVILLLISSFAFGQLKPGEQLSDPQLTFTANDSVYALSSLYKDVTIIHLWKGN